MPETTNNETYQPITFDAIKIGLASPSVKESSDQAKTGNVIVVNIKKSATQVLSVTDAELK